MDKTPKYGPLMLLRNRSHPSWYCVTHIYHPAYHRLFIPCPPKHYNDVTMSEWRLKSPASPFFAELLLQLQIKGNIEAPRHLPLCGELTDDREFPAKMASNAENVSI